MKNLIGKTVSAISDWGTYKGKTVKGILLFNEITGQYLVKINKTVTVMEETIEELKFVKVMTKTEQKIIITKHVINMVQKNFNVVEDFNDEEGHGYFTFAIEDNNNHFRFDMMRSDFSLLSHRIKGERFYEEARQLEKVLDEFITNEIKIVSIKEGIF